jgi:hypothetical protein
MPTLTELLEQNMKDNSSMYPPTSEQSQLNQIRQRCEQWEAMAEEQRQRVKGLEERIEKLQQKLIEAHQAYFRPPAMVEGDAASMERKNLERLMLLAGLDERNGLWTAVLSWATEHERTEREAALKPDLADWQRQYNSGRAASAYDFATALRNLYVKAQVEAKKLKS